MNPSPPMTLATTFGEWFMEVAGTAAASSVTE